MDSRVAEEAFRYEAQLSIIQIALADGGEGREEGEEKFVLHKFL
jgi:hypothetical protein